MVLGTVAGKGPSASGIHEVELETPLWEPQKVLFLESRWILCDDGSVHTCMVVSVLEGSSLLGKDLCTMISLV